jgi:CheY-like chemotaxis protein
VAAKAAPKRRILIAEDDEDAGLTLRMLLESLGYEAHLVRDGESAVRDTLRLRPDVVILDIGMPVLSGYDAAQLIRRSNPGRKILIVALSGWGRLQDVERSTAAGIDFHLLKPLDLAKLKAILDAWPKRGIH